MLNFNCATWTFPAHKFRQWANLASIFLVISLLLEQQTWFRVCVLTVVPITFRFHHSFDLMSSSINYIFLKTSRQICRDHCQQFDFFQVVCRNSGWEIPSLPLDELCYHRQHYCLPQHKLVHILCCILISLLSSLYDVLPWSITVFMTRMLWGLLHLLRILGIVILLTITILSWSSCWFQPGYQQVNGVVWIMHF